MRETRYRDAMITQEQNKKVQTIVRETLAERFSSDEFVFNPIVVVPMVDEYGSDASGEDVSSHHYCLRWRPEAARFQLDLRLHQAHPPEVD